MGTALLCALLSLTAWTAAAAQPADPQAAPAANPTLLAELAVRLLQPTYVGPGGETQRIELLPGALPPDLGFELPMPPESRLIGSAVRTGPPPDDGNTDVVVDAPGDAAALLRFYLDAFAAMGWRVPQAGGPRSPRGFQSETQPLFANFCQDQRGPWVSMTIVPKLTGPHDVRLNVQQMPGPCAVPENAPDSFQGPPGQNLVPLFVNPAGATLTRSTDFAGPGSWSSFAVAESQMTPAELEAYYAAQLTAAGWTRRDGSTAGPLAWSVWSVSGEGNWQGFLSVLDGPGPNQRTLQVQVNSPTIPGPRPGR